MKINAFITETWVMQESLRHLGEPISPPVLKPARWLALWEMPGCGPGEIDLQAQLAPDYEFNQRIAW